MKRICINFILLFLFINSFVDSFIITDITTNGIYVKYPNKDGKCNFSLKVLCTPVGNEVCSSIAVVEGKGSSISTYPLYNNGSSYAFQISVGSDELIGKTTVRINSISYIDIDCIHAPIDTFSLNSLSDYFASITSGFKLIFQLLGSNPDIPFDYGCFAPPSGCQVTQYELSFNKYMLVCDPIPLNWNLNSIQMQVTSNLNTVTLTLNTGYKRDNLLISDITTYPNSLDLQNYFQMGYNQNPLLSFKINSNLDKSIFYMSLSNGQQYTLVHPMFADDTSTTFFLPLNGVGKDIVYDLCYSNGTFITKLSNPNQIKTSITQFTLPPVPSGINYGYYIDTSILFYYFNSQRQVHYPPINTRIDYISDYFDAPTRFPFGYKLVNSTSITFEYASTLKSTFFNNGASVLFIYPDSTKNQFTIQQKGSETYNNFQLPKFKDFKIFNLEYDIFLYRVGFSAPYQFNYISDKVRRIGCEALTSGDTVNGMLEFIRTIDQIYLFDQYMGYNSYSFESLVNSQIFSPPTYNFQSLNDINQTSFLYDNIDVTNRRYYNVFYFNFSDSVPRDSVFRLVPNMYFPTLTNPSFQDVINGDIVSFPSTWNQGLKLFQIEFYIEANSPVGPFSFFLYYNNKIKLYSQTLNTQLIIKKTSFDNMGPIIKDIIKIQANQIDSANPIGYFGWTLEIEDLVNGFKSGYVTIKGEYDQSTYNITFSSQDLKSGNKYLGSYDIKANVSYPCLESQVYSIGEIKLVDTMNRISFFSIFTNSIQSSVINPFINYLNDSSIKQVLVSCAPSSITSDTTAPILNGISCSPSILDVSKTSRTISCAFTAFDSESSMKDHQLPIVYFSDSNNNILQCISNITQRNPNSYSYSCSIQVPLGFGYPGDISYSVYGFINNAGLVSGFSSKILAESGLNFRIFTSFNTNEPVLTGHSKQFNEKSTSLWLYGRGLENTTLVYIKYSDSTTITLAPSILYPTAAKFNGLKSTNKPLQVYIETKSSKSSNILVVEPIVYNYYLDVCNGNGIPNKVDGSCICNSNWITLDVLRQCMTINHYISTSSQVPSDVGGEIYIYGYFGNTYNNQVLYINNQLTNIISTTSTSLKINIDPGSVGPVIVNYTQNGLTWNGKIYPYSSSNVLCPVNCELNGICDKASGICKCFTGYTGLDCSSPSTTNNNNNNNNNNSTTSETQTNNNGTTIIKNQDIGYAISIESISEIDFYNNVVSTFNLLDNWILVNKSGSITTFNQIRSNQDETDSLIVLIIEEVQDKDMLFSFAGNQFTVMRGGFKLSISISNWGYQNNLNTLQIQMISDIQIDNKNNNNCNQDTNNALIESSSNNNYLSNNINYLKVTKNSRSFYARFQDKMLADDRPATVFTSLSKNDTIINGSNGGPSNSNNSIKIKIQLPRCSKCLIDPDFSLLITSDYKFTCNGSNSKWKVVVAIVVSVVGFLVLSILIFTIYKKSTFLKIRIYSLKKKIKLIK